MPRKHTPKVRICEWCGNYIGTERGNASKTCSPECQRDRNNDKERKRYQKVKDTDEWKETRASYIDAIKSRAKSDLKFAEHQLKQRREIYKRFRNKLESDPARLERYRAESRAWHQNLTREKKSERKYWYGQLNPELKAIFLSELRVKRAIARLQASIARTEEVSGWSENYTKFLGKSSDAAVARKLGMPAHVIRSERVKRGIEAFKLSNAWDSANDSLLGTVSDGELAKRFGTDRNVVVMRRRKLGVSSGEFHARWSAEEDAALGKDTDLQIAKKIGRSRAAVVQRRIFLGIPPASKTP